MVKEGSDELLGVFSKSDLVDPPLPRLVLVDHNEFSQAVAGAEEAEIFEVLDHHRLSGNLITKEPIQFINMTVGSTCTIVAQSLPQPPAQAPPRHGDLPLRRYHLRHPQPDLPDQHRYRPRDARVARPDRRIDADEFTREFFAAGSALQPLPIPELLNSDRKEFNESGFKISISQIEELNHSSFWAKEAELLQELDVAAPGGQLRLSLLLSPTLSRKTAFC